MTKAPLANYVLGLVLGLAFGLAVGSTVTHHVAMQTIHRVVAQDQAINEIAGKITEKAKEWKERAERCEAAANADGEKQILLQMEQIKEAAARRVQQQQCPAILDAVSPALRALCLAANQPIPNQ
jgi:predicted secreted protein